MTALVAFSNSPEINLIFICLQSRSLQGTQRVNRSVSPGKLPKHLFSGDLTGSILPHLSQRVFFPFPQTLLAYSPRFHFAVPTVQSDMTTGLIRKNVPFLVHLGNHEHKPGVCLKVIW